MKGGDNMPIYKKQKRTTISFSTAQALENLIDKYRETTYFKTKSAAIEQILLDYFLENGYIDSEEYTNIRIGKDKYYEE